MVKEAFAGYSKPSIAVDAVMVRVKDTTTSKRHTLASKQMQVLLVKKAEDSAWHLPGTILRLGETPSVAIDRIMETKTHTDTVSFEQLYTVADNPERDERGHIISIVYIGKYTSMELAKNTESDQYMAEWFWVTPARYGESRGFVSEVTGELVEDLMYDHNEIINDTLNRIKGKLMYTGIGFDFVDSTFTISELERVYRALYEKDIPSFRRSIAPFIEETGVMSKDASYRPAMLFRKKETAKK